jgi:hypothetical protein
MPDLKELADAIVANNDFDAAIIVCPKGEAGGTMTLATKKKKGQDDKNVFEGTEMLWKDLARVIGSGGQPAIIDREMLKSISESCRTVTTFVDDITSAFQAVRELHDKAYDSGHWPQFGAAHPLNSAMAHLGTKIAAGRVFSQPGKQPPSGTTPRNPGE